MSARSVYSIEPAKTGDALLDVVKVYLRWAQDDMRDPSIPHFVTSLGVEHTHTMVLVLRHGNAPVGFVDGELWYGPLPPYCVAYTKYFYVMPAHRGASGRLYKAILQWAKGNGAASLRTVVDDEEASMRWQRHKFQPCAVMLERRL